MLSKTKKFIILCFLFTLLFYNNVSATSHNYDFFSFNFQSINNNEFVYSGQKGYNQLSTGIHAINRVAASVHGIGSVPTIGNYLAVTAKFNMVTFTDSNLSNYLPDNYDAPSITDVAINDNAVTFESASLNVYKTDWNCDPYNAGVNSLCRTFTFEFSFILRNLPRTINDLAFACTYNQGIYTGYSLGFNNYFEYANNNSVNVEFAYDYNTALLQQQIQIQNMTLETLNQMNSSSDTYYNNYYNSVDNIEGQTTSDISNATNNQTTTLIGVISSFVTALNSVQSGSCELTLPFPNFVGGSQTVNPCSSKEKAPTLVAIGSSMFLIGVFIPFAFIVLKMIYNEIRSYTNG